jgi:hypothetical protein
MRVVMYRLIVSALLVTSSFVSIRAWGQDLVNPLPDVEALERLDLVRHWNTQLPMLARESALTMKYDSGLVFVQTDQGMIHCLDAESGQVKWSIKVNELNREVHPPAVTKEFVYVATGDSLIQVDRETGRFLWSKEMPHGGHRPIRVCELLEQQDLRGGAERRI